jgi:hypothetical protein
VSFVTSDEVKENFGLYFIYQEIDVLTMLTYKAFFLRNIPPSLTKKFANSFDLPILAIPIE